MAKKRRRVTPRTFVLNEQHELTREERSGGGRVAKLDFDAVDWATKANDLSSSLVKTAKTIQRSPDPIGEKRYFFLANPEVSVQKLSDNEKKAPDGTYAEETDYGKDHSRVLGRLGLDLIEVAPNGDAIVHTTPEEFAGVVARAKTLYDTGVREKSRWSTVASFGTIPLELRVDMDWLRSTKKENTDSVIELQPLLTRVEAEAVMRSIADLLTDGAKEKLTGTGTDYSGRHWLRGRLSHKSLRAIAKDYFSVQSIHAPLYSIAAAKGKRNEKSKTTVEAIESQNGMNLDLLPTVAVFDSGIPSEHQYLAEFRRGQFIPPALSGGTGSHGSAVASRLVFGEVELSQGMDALSSLEGRCRFVDVKVAGAHSSIHDKSVAPGMEGVIGAYPDARVYNFSFASQRSLSQLNEKERQERLFMAQDVDNFIFANDVIVVIAAGNSPNGVLPNDAYPNHFDDPNWQLGHWACCHNAMVCGAYIEGPSGGIATDTGWPSPFTRVGYGLNDTPVPGYAAGGGNFNGQYQFQNGMGVWVCTDTGRWEDRAGTSYAAPIVSRQAAFALSQLQQYCPSETRPFATTVKAFLTLTANHLHDPDDTPDKVAALIKRTLGYGAVSTTRLVTPSSRSAVYLWQGVIEGQKDMIRIQIPVPFAWYENANVPMLRVVMTSDVPVNAAVPAIWSSRKVKVKLRSNPEGSAFHPVRKWSRNHSSYPLTDNYYDLKKIPSGVKIKGDMWLLEIGYDELTEYHPNIEFDANQRVSVAAELFDAAQDGVSPQASVQSLPQAASMSRFSVASVPLRNPVVIKSGV